MGADRDKEEEEEEEEGTSILDETRRVVEDSPPYYLPFLSSRRQPFLHFPLLLVRARGKSPFVPAPCKERSTKTSRRLRGSGARETEALPAPAHYRTLFGTDIAVCLLHYIYFTSFFAG